MVRNVIDTVVAEANEIEESFGKFCHGASVAKAQRYVGCAPRPPAAAGVDHRRRIIDAPVLSDSGRKVEHRASCADTDVEHLHPGEAGSQQNEDC